MNSVRRFEKHVLVALAGAGLLMILYPVYVLTHQVQIAQNAALADLLGGAEKLLQLDEQTKTQDCRVQGPLPDHNCTPGAVFTNATKEKICIQGYSASVRSVSTSTKKKVFAEYDISYPVPYGTYEVDHLIPLAIGGSNDIANLFPEAASPYPGFKEKDVVENYLHEEVCAGHIALSVAQEQIAKDWLAIYSNLDEKTIQYYKNKYRSWADKTDNPT